MEVTMSVKLVLRDKTFEVKPGMTLRHSLEKANVPLESVLAIRDGELLTDEEILNDGERIKLIAVVSGG
jgi:sulfur carrier protein ThiS